MHWLGVRLKINVKLLVRIASKVIAKNLGILGKHFQELAFLLLQAWGVTKINTLVQEYTDK
jgi:hypothetical protein